MTAAENPVLVITCPARLESADERIKAKKLIDFWMPRGPDRAVCSFCGSLAEDEFLAWCERAAEPDSHVIVDTAEQPGKLYLYRRGITNPSLGAVKFYAFHWSNTEDMAIKAMRMRVVGKAIEVSVPRLATLRAKKPGPA